MEVPERSQLLTEHVRFRRPWQVLEQADNPKREALGPIPKLFLLT